MLYSRMDHSLIVLVHVCVWVCTAWKVSPVIAFRDVDIVDAWHMNMCGECVAPTVQSNIQSCSSWFIQNRKIPQTRSWSYEYVMFITGGLFFCWREWNMHMNVRIVGADRTSQCMCKFRDRVKSTSTRRRWEQNTTTMMAATNSWRCLSNVLPLTT